MRSGRFQTRDETIKGTLAEDGAESACVEHWFAAGLTDWDGLKNLSVRCTSRLRSVGMAAPLLVLNLCFPGDLWLLQGVGRSWCDYCLRPDLYLSFHYLRVSAARWCPYVPSLGSSGGKGTRLWFPPCRFCGPGLQIGIRCPPDSGQFQSSPEQSWWVAPTLTARVGAEAFFSHQAFVVHRNRILQLIFSTFSLLWTALSTKKSHMTSLISAASCCFPVFFSVGGIWSLHLSPCSAPDSEC